MKKRIFALILAVTFALSGCGNSKPNEELDKITNEIVMNQNGNIENPTAEPTATPTAEQAETQTPTEVPASEAEDSTENTSEETEEEKYYLTFEATTTEGEAWNSDRFADSKMTMINVWGTYCSPCLNEMPDLGEIASEYDAADFQLIGVICDVMEGDGEKNLETAKELIEQTQANYPHLLFNESLYESFMSAVSAVPTTFFVRQDGSLIGYLTGAQSKENWKSLIDRLLNEEKQ